jgi:hypothetical protein
MNQIKEMALGFYLAVASAGFAVFAIVGGIIREKSLPVSVVLLVIGIGSFVAASKLKFSLSAMAAYFFYVAAACCFIGQELYTITDRIAAIDTTSFETSFITAAVGIVLTVVSGFVSTILPQRKSEV